MTAKFIYKNESDCSAADAAERFSKRETRDE